MLPCGPGHVLGAEDRAAVAAQVRDALLQSRRAAVVVEADHVGLLELDTLPIGCRLLRVGLVCADPDARASAAGSARPRGPRRTPCAAGQDQVAALSRRLDFAVAVVVGVVRLVEDVPDVDALVVLERPTTPLT